MRTRQGVTGRTLIRTGLLGLTFCVLVVGETWAQAGAGSRNLPVDHWAYEQIGRLVSRGYLANLNPLVQPYRRIGVAEGLAQLDPAALAEPVAGWVRLLREEFAPELDRLSGRAARGWGLEVHAGARASTSRRLDPLRPLGDEDAWGNVRAGAWVETGPLAVETRLLGDMYLNDDPDGLDPEARVGARSDNAYLSVALPFGAVELGVLQRNWSPIGTRGLMVSDAATPYPQVAFEARVGRFALRSFLGELDTVDDTKRYLAAHRLDYRHGGLTISLGESILYGGPGAGPSLRFLNPAEALFFLHDNRPVDFTENLMLDGQLHYRGNGFAVFVEAFLDDIDVDPQTDDAEPLLYAFRVGARVSGAAPWLELGVEYEQVSAWAYRTPNVVDRYSYLGRGLGEAFSDYDRLTLTADLFTPLVGLRLTPLVQLQRQGEGDFRDGIPPQDEYLASPALFVGQKETTIRLGLRGRYQPNRYFWIEWDAGRNIVRDKDHVTGADVNSFEAVARAGVKLDLPLRRAVRR